MQQLSRRMRAPMRVIAILMLLSISFNPIVQSAPRSGDSLANSEGPGQGRSLRSVSAESPGASLLFTGFSSYVTNNGIPVGGSSAGQSGCIFELEFWNFGYAPDPVNVVIEVFPPSGPPTVLNDSSIYLEGTTPSGPNDWDGSGTYSIESLLLATPPTTADGWSVRLTVTIPVPSGSQVLIDDYFITDCVAVPATPTPTPTET
ncbi:MAG: hypothetical protein R2845_14400 [Thermomicrobiales bacterium]